MLTPALKNRIRRSSLHSKVTTADKLIPEFKDGMYIGWSGFTGVGYPVRYEIERDRSSKLPIYNLEYNAAGS
jgi:acetyl-CoA hydrolase